MGYPQQNCLATIWPYAVAITRLYMHSISLGELTKLGEGKYGVRETKGEEQS